MRVNTVGIVAGRTPLETNKSCVFEELLMVEDFFFGESIDGQADLAVDSRESFVSKENSTETIGIQLHRQNFSGDTRLSQRIRRIRRRKGTNMEGNVVDVTDSLVTTAEAGRMLGVSTDTVRRYLEAGKLRGVRIGDEYGAPVRVYRSSVLELIKPIESEAR